jgi:hypothetical protein
MTAKKVLKDRVASFRVSRTVDSEVAANLTANPIAGCDTTNKFYRKLALDYHAGRLVYKNPDDALADPEVLNAMKAIDSLPAAAPVAPKG